MITSAMMPLIGQIVLQNHSTVDYGSAYALTEFAYCLSFMLGSPIMGYIISKHHWFSMGDHGSGVYLSVLCVSTYISTSIKTSGEQIPLMDDDQSNLTASNQNSNVTR
ncbi:unnamed protein product [Adineta ricciae]|uniref:Uncharacterized protein n=1 Tax=Adineta ricciae TaxID=249248 RepID=A0A813TXS2_ADIRI|nr:unnamed protein product [Adineta ricciae]